MFLEIVLNDKKSAENGDLFYVKLHKNTIMNGKGIEKLKALGVSIH